VPTSGDAVTGWKKVERLAQAQTANDPAGDGYWAQATTRAALAAYRELRQLAGRRRVRVTCRCGVARVRTRVRGTRIAVADYSLDAALYRAVLQARKEAGPMMPGLQAAEEAQTRGCQEATS